MTYDKISRRIEDAALTILGGFAPRADDGAPEGCRTLLLLGPGPDFWPRITRSAEFQDAAPDPIDRWSRRVISGLAGEFDATPIFPFGGPPYAPFYSWALRSGRVWSSPVAFLVHDVQGLFVSFRGALSFAMDIPLPPVDRPRPCDECAQPCVSACPVGALTPTGYDVPNCKDFLGQDAGQPCLMTGCGVRRACPVGATLRHPEQSAYHMAEFLGNAPKSADAL